MICSYLFSTNHGQYVPNRYSKETTPRGWETGGTSAAVTLLEEAIRSTEWDSHHGHGLRCVIDMRYH